MIRSFVVFVVFVVFGGEIGPARWQPGSTLGVRSFVKKAGGHKTYWSRFKGRKMLSPVD